jgi:hypothetical protein
MYQFDMTDDEVKEAKWASKEVAKHLDGVRLLDGLRIGAVLLQGRNAAMKAARTNQPQGKAYAEALQEWKKAFKFREGKEAQNYYDYAIVCAQHRSIADGIIATLSDRQRHEMGMSGLAKRVRAKLREIEDGPKPVKPPKPKGLRGEVDDVKGELADLRERIAAAEPRAYSEVVDLIVRRKPVEFLELLRLAHGAWRTQLVEAVREAAEWDAGLPEGDDGEG